MQKKDDRTAGVPAYLTLITPASIALSALNVDRPGNAGGGLIGGEHAASRSRRRGTVLPR